MQWANVKDKSYKPVRVKDPSSMSHSISLVPGQKFEVFLSNSPLFSNLDVTVKSDFIEVEGVFPASHRDGRIYRFRQKTLLNGWNRVSTTYLGEVRFRNTSTNFSSNLCVFMASENPYKKNIITVLNPDGHTVKIQPYQILEVVLYDSLWGKPLYWEWDTSTDPRFEPMCWNYIDPNNYDCASSVRKTSDAFFMYPRSNETMNRSFLEYHFWFRCNPKIVKHLHKLPQGFYPTGSLLFNGCVGMDVKTNCNLNVVFNPRRCADPTTDRVQAVTLEDSDMTMNVKNLMKKTNSLIPLALTESRKKPKVYGIGNIDWSSCQKPTANTSQWQEQRPNWMQKTNHHTWCAKQKMTVKIVKVDDDFWENCTVKHLDEIETQIPLHQYYQ